MTASASQPRPVRRERRIIERPRLIKLLDETEARTILLLAPAGYGKTTLARQWAKTLQSVVWVSLTPRHHDVAWLAADIAEAIDGEGDTASRAIAEHLNARSNPQRAARQLGVALAEQLNAARVQWLVLDDYHAVDGAHESEAVLDPMREHSEVRTLIASRTRPSWATSRSIIYDDIAEVSRQQLAMTSDESAQLLNSAKTDNDLARQARGWPALVALAAKVNAAAIPRNALPEALHDYLADELFHRASTELQENLMTLALLGELSSGALDARFGREAKRIVDEATALGFSSGQDVFDLHPLLREFLMEKVARSPKRETRVRQALDANLTAGS
jgi:ATP/maltotriose-dependent transcriptional regulator MalT